MQSAQSEAAEPMFSFPRITGLKTLQMVCSYVALASDVTPQTLNRALRWTNLVSPRSYDRWSLHFRDRGFAAASSSRHLTVSRARVSQSSCTSMVRCFRGGVSLRAEVAPCEAPACRRRCLASDVVPAASMFVRARALRDRLQSNLGPHTFGGFGRGVAPPSAPNTGPSPLAQ